MLSLIAPLLLAAAAATSTKRQSNSNGCDALSKNVPNTIFYRGDDVYKYESKQFWSNNEIMDPECVFRPSSADEVAQAVQIMQDTNTQFAVRGGGHMAIKVCASLLYFLSSRSSGQTTAKICKMPCLRNSHSSSKFFGGDCTWIPCFTTHLNTELMNHA